MIEYSTNAINVSFFDGVSEVDGSLVGLFIIRFRGQSDEGDGLALLQIGFQHQKEYLIPPARLQLSPYLLEAKAKFRQSSIYKSGLRRLLAFLLSLVACQINHPERSKYFFRTLLKYINSC